MYFMYTDFISVTIIGLFLKIENFLHIIYYYYYYYTCTHTWIKVKNQWGISLNNVERVDIKYNMYLSFTKRIGYTYTYQTVWLVYEKKKKEIFFFLSLYLYIERETYKTPLYIYTE